MDEEKHDLASAALDTTSGSNEPAAPPALIPRFRDLARRWKEETVYSSSLTEITQHPVYQQIITLGRDVIPLILDELRREPDYWFAALKALTGADPVAPADRGKVRRMADAWIDWAKANGF